MSKLCIISIMVGARLRVSWFFLFIFFILCLLLFHAVAVCHLKRHCQSFPSRSLWLDFQILISSTAFTHCLSNTHTHSDTVISGWWNDSQFHSSYRCLRLAASPLRRVFPDSVRTFSLPPAFRGIVLALPTSFSDFLLLHPSLPVFLHFLFVTIQPTCFSYISSALPFRPRQTLSHDTRQRRRRRRRHWRSAVTATGSELGFVESGRSWSHREVEDKRWSVNGD